MDGGAREDDKFDGPLEERLVHKNWKCRTAAYEELKKNFQKAFDPSDDVFSEYASFFKKIVVDSNQAAQAEGLEALAVFVDRADIAPRLTPTIAPLLVEKGLSAARASTKAKAQEILLMFIEREDVASVNAALFEGIANKQPKICAASLVVLREALKLFGGKVMGTKAIVKELIAKGALSHGDGSVRSEAQSLLVEAHRHLGPALPSVLGADTLRPAQQKDLQTAIDAMGAWTGPAKPERLLRSQQAVAAAAPTAAEGEDASAAPTEDTAAADAFDEMEVVNFDGKIPAEVYEAFASSKWKDRSEALDKVTAMMTPRMTGRDLDELARAAKKLIAGDANVLVVGKAVKLVGLIAGGMRRELNVLPLLPALFDKLKEKKQSVSDAIHEALDLMYGHCFVLGDAQAEIDEALKHKVAKVRADTITWLARAIPRPGLKATIVPMIKSLMQWLIAALDDSAPEVRDAAAKCIGALAGTIGERPLTPFLMQLDNVRQQKVREHIPANAMQIPLPVVKKDPAAAPAVAKQATKKPAAKGAPAPTKTPAPKAKGAPAPAAKPTVVKQPSTAAKTAAPAPAAAAAPSTIKAAAKPKEFPVANAKPAAPPAAAPSALKQPTLSAKAVGKAAAATATAAPAPAPAPAAASAKQPPKPALKKPTQPDRSTRVAMSENLLADDELLAPVAKQQPNELAGWTATLSRSTDETAVIAALQAITNHMTTSESEWATSGQLEPLCASLHTQLRRVFGAAELPIRTCKYLLNTLMELFKRPALAGSFNKKALQPLVDEILNRLVDPKVAKMDELLRALNSIMLKILENGSPTISFTVLISLLSESSAASAQSASAKYAELVMKCLLKLTKALPGLVPRLDSQSVLAEMDVFLSRTSRSQEMPIKTIKTILHELVKLHGSAILQLIPSSPLHPTLLRQYAELMLAQQQPAKSAAAPAEIQIPAVVIPQQPQLPVVVPPSYSENVDPNPGSADLAAGFMERLKNLREKYNINKSGEAPAAAESATPAPAAVSAEELRQRLAATKTRLAPTLEAANASVAAMPPAAVSSSSSSVASGSSLGGGSSAQQLSSLQERLARIKNNVIV